MFTPFQAALGMWKTYLFGYSLVSMDQSFRGQKRSFGKNWALSKAGGMSLGVLGGISIPLDFQGK